MSNHSIDLFLEACGAAGPLELSIASQGGQDTIQRALYQPFVLVGREPRSSLILNHSHVSRRHAYLQLVGGRVFCMDLQSRTGTYWESGPKRSGWLDFGQAIRIGPYWIRAVAGAQSNGAIPGANGAAAARTSKPENLPLVTLEFLNQTGKSSTWQMSPVLALVGKAPECRVHLVGESVSSFHCSLVRTKLGVWVVDLIGRGGIWVNEMVVRCCRLDDGDQLQVGKFKMRIHYDGTSNSGSAEIDRPELEAVSWGPALTNSAFPSPESITPPPAPNPPPEIVLSATPSPGAPVSPLAGPDGMPALGRDLMLVPPELTLPPGSDPSHALLVPIARQMGLMQQQMFDQFQQAMMMMFQMFNTLQRDQIGVIRQELNRLHELSHELQTLQMELAKRSGPTPAGPAATEARVNPAGDRTRAAPSRPQAAAPPAPRAPEIRPQPAAPAPLPSKTAPEAPPLPQFNTVAEMAVANGKEAAVAADQTTSEDPAVPPGPNDDKFHAWIAGRIASIQEERQTRWQKVVGFLSGK